MADGALDFTPEQLTHINTLTQGLKDKNTELIGKVKKITTTLEGLGDTAQLIADAKELKKLQKKQAEDDNDLTKLNKQLNQDFTELKTSTTATRLELDALKRSSALKTELVKLRVDPILLDTAEQILLPRTQFEKDDGVNTGSIVADDKPLGDFLKDWATTDVGKRFVSEGHSGGGAGGSHNSTSTPEAKFFDKKSKHYSVTEQAKVAKNNPALYAKLAK